MKERPRFVPEYPEEDTSWKDEDLTWLMKLLWPDDF